MPYQRSTQARGFQQRTVQDDSKKLRQYATELDKRRKEDVKNWERQDALWEKETTRIDSLATAKDKYEIANLSQFSKTLNNFLKVTAEDVIKPINETQVDDGVLEGVKAAQGDEEALNSIKLSEAQVAEINAAVELQRAKVLKTTEGIEKEWDASGYKASLEEKYRLLNLKKLGGNHAHGMRIGLLMEAASGWNAFLESALTNNPEVAISQETIKFGDRELTIGNYRSYNSEEKKAILAHVQKQYLLEKGAGMKSSIVNKYLTRPVLEKTATFQNQEYERELANWGVTQENDLKTRFSLSLKNIDTDTTNLKTSIEEIFRIYPQIATARNLEGSPRMNTKKFIMSLIKDEASLLKVGAMANVDDQEDFINFANNVPIVIEGITPKEGTPLFKIWPADFNEAGLRLDLLTASSKRVQEKTAAMKLQADSDWQKAFLAFRQDGSVANYDAQLRIIEEKYGTYITGAMRTNWAGAIKVAVMPIDQARKYLAEDIFKDENTVLFVGDKALARVPQVLINEYMDQGKIIKEKYQFPTDEAVHLGKVQELKTFIKTHLTSVTGGTLPVKFDDDHPQVIAFENHVTQRLHKVAWQIYDEKQGKEGGITLAEAFREASTQILGEVKAGQGIYSTDATMGFDQEQLNPSMVDETQLGNIERSTYARNTVAKALELSREKGVNVFLSPEIPVIVDRPEFYKLLNNGEVQTIWHDLENQTGIPREILYNWQAAKLDPALGIKPKVWSQDVQNKLELWKKTNPEDWADLNSGDSVRLGRALNKINIVDVEGVARAVLNMDTGYLPVSSDEYKGLLSDLGLDASLSYEEFLAKPELVAEAFKLKTANLIDQVETMTNNPRDGIRMVLAGLKYGDVNQYNTPQVNSLYSVYLTDDTDLLTEINSKFNMNPYKTNIQFETNKVDFYREEERVSTFNTIESIDQELATLDGEIPEKVIVIEKDLRVSAGPFSNMIGQWAGLDKKTIVNPEYTQYVNRKQSLLDRKLILEKLASGQLLTREDLNYNLKYRQTNKTEAALNRILGDRLPGIIEKARSMEGDIYDNYMKLIMVEPEFVNFSYPGINVTDEADSTSLSAEQYENQGVRGNIGEQDLTTVTGFGGNTVQIRNDVRDPLQNMINAATKDGIQLHLTDGYRTIEDQTRIKSEFEAKGEGHLAANPGESDHEVGIAVDFNLYGSVPETFPEKVIRKMMNKLGNDDREVAIEKLRDEHREKTHNWLIKNHKKFGFEPYAPDLKSGDDESWHWIYTGVKN